MKSETLINIAKIIEQDNKTSTYKFALLRGTIDIIQDNTPYLFNEEGRVYLPMGLLINKWIFYYYPLLSNAKAIPQINSPKGLAFESELSKIIGLYESKKAGMSVLYNDLRLGNLQGTHLTEIKNLYNRLKSTIAQMPMRHLGYSIYKKYFSIFKYHREDFRRSPINRNRFIHDYGYFSIPVEYYKAFKVLGSFVSGQESLIAKWADFSFSSSGNKYSDKSHIIGCLLSEPITEREVKESKKYYRELLASTGKITCVWTGKKLNRFDVDHVIPFSVWKNNDLWNLLPSSAIVNKNKRDKIPSPDTIEHAKERIYENWDILYKSNELRFRRELENSLLGNTMGSGWKHKALYRIKANAQYLIKNRGYEEWKL
jgi:hypothetical protein